MLLSDMAKKEIVDGNHAEKLGMPGHMDLVIEEEDGRIKEVIISASPLRKKSKNWRFPWNEILKIGDDVVIINTEKQYSPPE